MTERERIIRDEHVRLAFDKYVENRKNGYKILRAISSEGAFSSVYEVRDAKGKVMIMKAVDTAFLDVNIDADEVVKYTKNELDSMLKCKACPYIMDLIDSGVVSINPDIDEYVFLIFMPKMQVATEYFSNNGYKLSRILSMAKDICRALDYCHSKDILHRDVKPENLYYSEEKGHFVLSDFGVSRTMFDHSRAVTRIGSLLAPEILSFQDLKGRKNSDIYSLGITILLFNSMMSRSAEVLAERFNNLKSDVKDVLLKAIDGNPAIRYQTAKDFLRALETVKVDDTDLKAQALNIENCVNSFLNKDYKKAEEIAAQGHREGVLKMTCMYAYILSCQKKIKEALTILRPLVNSGNAVAMGLYGIIGRLETINNNAVKDREMVGLILESAKRNFSIAQYYIGRWMIDGESGFKVDIENGLEYIFESSKRGFLPAMHYLRKTLTRNSDKFVSVESMVKLMDIALTGFSKEYYPDEVIKAIVCA